MAALPTIGVATKEVLTPDDALAQARLQRRMALAQMLQQNAADASNAYGSVNGMRVVPRLGFGPGIAQIAETLMGGLQQRAALKDQQTLAQQMAARQAQAVDSAYGGGTGAAAGGGANPNLGLSKEAFADWYRNNPSEALKFAAEHQALTEQNRQYVQQGRDLNDVGALNRATEVVKGTQTFQPGTTNVIPGVAQPFVAADFGKGTVGGYDASGQPTLEGIRGNDVIARLAAQLQAAQQANTILPNVPLRNGASVPMWGGQAAGSGAGAGAGAPAKTFDNQAINTQAADFVNRGYMSQEQADRWIQDQYAKQPGAQINVTPDNAGATPAGAWVPEQHGGLPAPVPIYQEPQGIGQSTLDKALSEKRAANIGALEEKINQDASSGVEARQLANQMLKHVDQINTGPFAQNLTQAKSFLNSIGYSGADPTSQQEFNKYAMQYALAKAKALNPTRPTNADLEMAARSNPSQEYTKQAIKELIAAQNEQADNAIRKGTVYQAYKANGGDPLQFDSYFNQNYPALGVKAPTSAAPGTSTGDGSKKATPVRIRTYNPQTGKLEG